MRPHPAAHPKLASYKEVPPPPRDNNTLHVQTSVTFCDSEELYLR